MPTRTEYTVKLKNKATSKAKLVGGKGRSLIKMTTEDIPVPQGYIVTTEAYNKFLDQTGIKAKLRQTTRPLHQKSPNSQLKTVSKSARQLILEQSVPDEVSKQIIEAHGACGIYRAAVRSSAFSEDAPQTSFAGQHDSFLNVSDTETLLDAVLKCWASLFNYRAVTYRINRNIDFSDASMAVVVQKMIDGNRSGTLFTADPTTERRDHMVISSAYGLGESIVDGKVTPDQWRLDKYSENILKTEINQKETMTVPWAAHGTRQQKTPENLRGKPSLDEKELSRLKDMGEQIEDIFDAPQDIEWVAKDEEIYIVQSRPITGLYPLAHQDPEFDNLRIYYCLTLGPQGMIEPMTPMGIEVFKMLYKKIRPWYSVMLKTDDIPDLEPIGGRLFLDLTDLLKNKNIRNNLSGALNMLDPLGSDILYSTINEYEEELGLNEQPENKSRPGLKAFGNITKISLRMLGWIVLTLLSPKKAVDRNIRMADNVIEKLTEKSDDLTQVRPKLRFLKDSVPQLIDMLLPAAAVIYVGLGSQFVVRSKLLSWFGDDSMLDPVLQSLPHNPTTEMGLELAKLSEKIPTTDVDCITDTDIFQDFLQKYGHRSVREIDIGVPRWKEDPSWVFDLLKSFEDENGENAVEKFERHKRQAEQAKAEIIDRVRKHKSWLTEKLIAYCLHLIRELCGLRERPKFDLVRYFDICRDVLKEAGHELYERNRLDDPDDIFFLRFRDLEREASLRRIVAQNRRTYERELNRKQVPPVIMSTGEAVYSTGTEDGALRGAPVSPGIYEGKVRVIEDPEGVTTLKSGEILVTRSTDPAWTPLFLRAGALVMEVGGLMSHGSVVAREYGIPAVSGIQNITEILETGQKIRVNGDAGEISIID